MVFIENQGLPEFCTNWHQKADVLLIDEHKGRGVAKKMSVEHIGTMGIFMMEYDKGIY